jgi:hypothetical protein
MLYLVYDDLVAKERLLVLENRVMLKSIVRLDLLLPKYYRIIFADL